MQSPYPQPRSFLIWERHKSVQDVKAEEVLQQVFQSPEPLQFPGEIWMR